jgi:hypothetical protein
MTNIFKNVFNKVEKEFTHLEDLLYYDGPLLSLYTGSDSEKALFLALNLEHDENQRWGIVLLTKEQEKNYFEAKEDLRTIMLSKDFLYTFEYDQDWNVVNFTEVKISNYSEDDLPSKGLYNV